MATTQAERFVATGGRLPAMGGFAILALVTWLSATGSEGGFGWPGVVISAGLAVVLWATLLRPAVWASAEHLTLRGLVDTVRIPLAAIDAVAVRQFLVVASGERQWTCSAISRSGRQLRIAQQRADTSYAAGEVATAGMIGTDKAAAATERRSQTIEKNDYGTFVEERILSLADNARARSGIRKGSPEAQEAKVVKTRAWWIVGALAVDLVVFVALLVR